MAMPSVILASVFAAGCWPTTLPTSDALSVCVISTVSTSKPAALIAAVASAWVSPTTAGTTPVRFRYRYAPTAKRGHDKHGEHDPEPEQRALLGHLDERGRVG